MRMSTWMIVFLLAVALTLPALGQSSCPAGYTPCGGACCPA